MCCRQILTCSLSAGGWNPAGRSKPLPFLSELVGPGAHGRCGSPQHHPAGLLPLLHPSAAAGQRHARGHAVAPHTPAQQPAGTAGRHQQVAEQVGTQTQTQTQTQTLVMEVEAVFVVLMSEAWELNYTLPSHDSSFSFLFGFKHYIIYSRAGTSVLTSRSCKSVPT